jgi:hypothetical protein
MLIKNDR